jgi:hypothetical protein
MPDSKQEIKHLLERPFFGKTKAGVTFEQFMIFRHCKEYRYEPKPDIRDYIREEWIHKCPLYMDMFGRKRLFHVFCPQL